MTLLVLKAGGRVAAGTASEVRALVAQGFDVCVVHGAGPQISAELERRGLEVVREAFVDVNRELCAAIGPLAVGLVGDEIGLPARRVPKLGLVGEPIPSAPPAILAALAEGLVPVVAPLAVGPLNVNADDAAAALAVGLGAERILFVSDVPGVLLGGATADSLDCDEAEELIGAGRFEGGIVPKLEAAVRAARGGVRAEIGLTAVLP